MTTVRVHENFVKSWTGDRAYKLKLDGGPRHRAVQWTVYGRGAVPGPWKPWSIYKFHFLGAGDVMNMTRDFDRY